MVCGCANIILVVNLKYDTENIGKNVELLIIQIDTGRIVEDNWLLLSKRNS